MTVRRPLREYGNAEFKPYGIEFQVYKWVSFHNGFRVSVPVAMCDWMACEDIEWGNSTTLDTLLEDIAREFDIPVKDLFVRYD